MVKRSKGLRSKSRKILRKKPKDRGIKSISRALQQFENGETVNIVIDSAIHKGMPHIRFHGKTGKIEGKQGNSFVVGVNDGNKHKTLVIRSEHLRRAK